MGRIKVKMRNNNEITHILINLSRKQITPYDLIGERNAYCKEFNC